MCQSIPVVQGRDRQLSRRTTTSYIDVGISTDHPSTSAGHLEDLLNVVVQTGTAESLYSPTIIGIDAFVAFPTVGKVRPDMFHVIGLVEGAKVNLVSSWHKTTSDVKSRCIITAEIEIAYHSLISSCENMKPLIIPTNQRS